MLSSDYVPVNKRKYIHRLIELEAENKLLRRKIKIYEILLRNKIIKQYAHVNYNDVENKNIECQDNDNNNVTENETKINNNETNIDDFKTSAINYLKNPNNNEKIISSLVQRMITPTKEHNITGEKIRLFLHDF